MLTCVLQRAPAGVVAHTVHTDTPIDTGVLHTVICVHSTGRPFKTGGTGAPVVEGAGVDEEGQGKPGHWSEPLVHMFGAWSSRLPGRGEGLASARIPAQEGRQWVQRGLMKPEVRRQDLPIYSAQIFQDTDRLQEESNDRTGPSSGWAVEGTRS